MDPNILYEICSTVVLPAWLLLILAPTWKWTDRLVNTVWVIGLLCMAYGIAIVFRPDVPTGGDFFSLEGVALLLGTPYGALLGWIHFLAFDLFVGAWIVRDAVRLKINHLFIVPSLGLTFMYGPLGLLLYFATRLVIKRISTLQEGFAH